jgi:dCTP deaminase
MWLCDRTIKDLVSKGRIGIEPFDAKLVQPASVDCRLGRELSQMAEGPAIDPYRASEARWRRTVVPDGEAFRLASGEFVLGHTVETYRFPADVLGFVNGKSSLARIGLAVHVTAGVCDPGFEGQITLELSNIGRRDILLWPGMPVAQIVFAALDREAERPYGSPGLGSKYQGQSGVTTSRYDGGPALAIPSAKKLPQLLRPEDAAKLLSISKSSIYRLARSGALPPLRIGTQIRFRAEAVEDLATRAETEGVSVMRLARPPQPSPRRGRPRVQVGQRSHRPGSPPQYPS